MNIPMTSPQMNANLDSDESIKQDGVTINANNGSVINSNSSNGRGEVTRLFAMLMTIFLSIIGDVLIVFYLRIANQELRSEIIPTISEMQVEQTNAQSET